MPDLSLLDIVNLCDNCRVHQPDPVPSPYDSERLVPFYLSESPDSPVIGLLRPVIVEQLKLENQRSRDSGQRELWALNVDESNFVSRRNRPSGPSVSFRDWLDTHTKRTVAMKELCERWRDTLLFEDVCGPKKWREELYPVYADPFGVHDHPNTAAPGQATNFVFEMERSACALFGVVTYGVHMTIYDEVEVDGEKTLRVWVPTRALSKPTFPGMLDNTVAGGIGSGMSVFETLVKECMEEASIPEHVVRKYTRASGAVSYFYRTSKGWLQPEVEYVYELAIPAGVDPQLFEPRPSDGEVESFELLTHTETIRKMRQGLFKPNCALVLLNLYIRLGYVTPDDEPDYMKILTRLHGTFDFERW
ncbi:putative NUDIX domain containing protein [Lyophyllum shimeji]|uniref:NUDIX domain containing protein n=1 Tax=Lyophyllum shimeji TaxID=47721 RepID=A0A9P3PNM3_LYOSH|nr:putative NUDIX domain containing protein [Lyophyllum shimeji]